MNDATWHCIRCGTITKPGERLCTACREAKVRGTTAQGPKAGSTSVNQTHTAATKSGAERLPGLALPRRRGPRRSKKEWQQIAREYIEGVGDGYRILAREHKVSLRQVKRKSQAEGWRAQRATYRALIRAKIFGFPLEPDEPTFALKASDSGAATLLHSWANNVELYGGDLTRAQAVRATADAFDAWKRSRKKALRGK